MKTKDNQELCAPKTELITTSYRSTMHYCAIGIITFIVFHFWMIRGKEFYYSPQEDCQENSHCSSNQQASYSIFIPRLKSLLFTTIFIFFPTAAWAGIISIGFHSERLKRKLKKEQQKRLNSKLESQSSKETDGKTLLSNLLSFNIN